MYLLLYVAEYAAAELIKSIMLRWESFLNCPTVSSELTKHLTKGRQENLGERCGNAEAGIGVTCCQK